MWLDPRIQGRMRELLNSVFDTANQDIQRALDLAKEALAFAEQSGNKPALAEAKFSLGRILLNSGNIEEAIQKYTAAIEYAESAHELNHLAHAYVYRGRALVAKGDLDKAEDDINTAILLCERHHLDIDILFDAYAHLGELYIAHGRLKEAVDTSEKVKTLLEEFDTGAGTKKELSWRSELYELLGHLSLSIEDYPAARKHFIQSAEIYLKIQKPLSASTLYQNVGVTYFDEGDIDKAIEYTLTAKGLNYAPHKLHDINLLVNLAAFYLKAGEFEKAEITIDEALQLSRESKDAYLSKVLRAKGEILMARNDPTAIDFLLQDFKMVCESGDPTQLSLTIETIINYYLQRDDFKQAFHYQQELLQIRQKVNDEQKQAVLKLETARSEQVKKIVELELQKTQTKLQHQERELTLTASQLASQADLLSHFRNDLRKIVREMGDPIDALKHIKQRLKDLPCEQIDWAKFESEFVDVHPEFRSLLADRYPNLTAQEIKMCMLVRLGLKNAEIAKLTCLSERTVDNHRFNLRKKLGIKTEQNLTQFLATIKVDISRGSKIQAPHVRLAMETVKTFEEQFAHGVELFNNKEFFDCHDEWEELWQVERSERRLFLQGMIQAAVGSYHLTNGNTTGAISQYTKSLDKLRQYAPDYFGINLEGLRSELERCLDGALTMQSQNANYPVADEYFPLIGTHSR